MMRLSRLGLAALFAAALAAPARAAEPDKLLPADADTVMYVNVKQLIESDIVKKYALEQIKQALAGQDAKKLLEELGLDPLKDVEKMWVGTSGKDASDMKALVVVHGKFDPDKLFKAAEAQSKKDGDRFTMVKDGKDVMFKYQPDNGNPMYGTVVDKTTVVVATDKKIITTASAAFAAGKASAASKDLSALISKMDDKASMWVCAVTKDKLNNVKLPGGGGGMGQNIQGQLAKMDSVTVTLRVTGDISLDVNLGMATEAAADEMGKTVEEGLGTIKGALPFLAANDERMKPLVDVVKTLKSEVKSKVVSVSAKLPGAVLGKLINMGD